MIQMQLTSAGMAAITRNTGLSFTRFVAGSGVSTQETIAQSRQSVPIGNLQTYISGQTYTINGQQTTVDYNAVEVTGVLSASQASVAYDWTELALMAQESGGAEFTLAYGSTSTAYHIDPTETVSFAIPFTIIFSTSPNATVETTATGVPWTTFLGHSTASVSSGAHGLQVSNGDISVDGQSLGLAKRSELLASTGVSSVVSTLPTPTASLTGSLVLLRTSGTLYRLEETEHLVAGNYIVQSDTSWSVGNGTETGALLVVADTVTPSTGEVVLSEAQAHFLTWEQVYDIDDRLKQLETGSVASQALSLAASSTEYNTEWVARMTGSGTEASPYLIYTPYDLNAVRNNSATAFYTLMADLDMSSAIGLQASVVSGELIYGTPDTNAPLYNSGSGWTPLPEFKGTFNGNGHTIKGLVCSNAVSNRVGLFSYLNTGTVKNLCLKNCYTIATNSGYSCGSVAGAASGSTFRNVFVRDCCVISSVAARLGGICGINAGSQNTLEDCAFHGRVQGTGESSGITGSTSASNAHLTLLRCAVTGQVIGTKAAGLVYQDSNSTTTRPVITSSYSAAGVSGYNGSTTTYAVAKDADFTRVYGLNGTYATTPTDVTLMTADQLKSADIVTNLNTGLLDDAYVADSTSEPANSGYPLHIFERNLVEGIPGTLSIAIVDPDRKKIYDTRVSYNSLTSLARKSELQHVSFADAVLTTSGWALNSASVYEQSISVSAATATSTGTLIPRSADCFTHGIALSALSAGTATFTASTQPSADLTVGLIIVS